MFCSVVLSHKRIGRTFFSCCELKSISCISNLSKLTILRNCFNLFRHSPLNCLEKVFFFLFYYKEYFYPNILEGFVKSFVIFICTFDLFKRNRALYFFENLCRDEPDLPLGDERYTIFLNTKSSQSSSNEDMVAFFRSLNGGTSTIGTGEESGSAFVNMLDNYVVGVNGNEEWRQGYMKYELNLVEEFKKGETKGFSDGVAEGETRGISIGRVEGETRGKSNERSRIVKAMYSDGLSVEKISKYASIPVEQIHSILNA